MNDLERAYAAIAQEADAVRLTTAEVVRARADRRAGVRVATACIVIAVVVGGVTVGSRWVFKASGSPTQVGTSPTPSVTSSSPTGTASASPSPAGTGSPTQTRPALTSIPDRAFLQLADTNGDQAPYAVPADDILPSLCGAKYASDASIQARRTMHITYWKTRRPTVADGTFDETITTYQSDGATRFLAQLRAAVTACPTQTRNNTTYKHRLLSGSRYGDDSMLFEMRYPTRDVDGNPVGGDDVRLISVVRIGAVVMVLYERGWEAGWSADRVVVDTFTNTALSRLRGWLD
jgi:hypothetical protein